jgi:hypothetical protein
VLYRRRNRRIHRAFIPFKFLEKGCWDCYSSLYSEFTHGMCRAAMLERGGVKKQQVLQCSSFFGRVGELEILG